MIGRLVLSMLALAMLGACGTTQIVTRGGADEHGILSAFAQPPQTRTEYALRHVEVIVPDSLKVSEANVFVPIADIVWRGDPFGERHAQVKAIVRTAFTHAGATRGRPVNATVEVLRFHGLTEKARYVTGGIYAIHFRLTLTDPKTGTVLDKRIVNINVPQPGGYMAMLNDHDGNSEKRIVTRALVRRIRHELGQPDDRTDEIAEAAARAADPGRAASAG